MATTRTDEWRKMSNAENQLHVLALKWSMEAKYHTNRMPTEVRCADPQIVCDMLDKLWPLDKARDVTTFVAPQSVLFGIPVYTDETLPRDGFALVERDGSVHWFSATGWL